VPQPYPPPTLDLRGPWACGVFSRAPQTGKFARVNTASFERKFSNRYYELTVFFKTFPRQHYRKRAKEGEKRNEKKEKGRKGEQGRKHLAKSRKKDKKEVENYKKGLGEEKQDLVGEKSFHQGQ